MSRFSQTFSRLRAAGATGLFPYLTASYPDVATSRALAQAALAVGVDGFEIAVPFSDPLADGPTLQRANARALANGGSLETALELARFVRDQSPSIPLAVMSYYNPLLKRGDATVAADLRAAGVDALIVADLPTEESGALRSALAAVELDLVPLLAPTSSEARVRAVALLDPVFVYCVALVGVTGARADLSTTLGAFLARVGAATGAPRVVGFGIARPEHVRMIASLGADGAIVASALTDLIEHAADPVLAARHFLEDMKQAGSRVGVG